MSETEISALVLSLKVASLVTVALLVPGISLGWLLSRRSFPGKTLVEGAIQLPLVLPPVATGYLLLLVFGQNGYLGGPLQRWTGLQIPFTFWGAALAGAVMALPLMVRSIRLAMELVPPRLEQAARSLGSGPLRTLFRVTLPLAAPGLVAGMMLSFARCLGEFGATITLAGNVQGETQTIPLAIFSSLQLPGGEAATMRLVLISAGLSMGALIASQALANRVRKRVEGT